MTQLRHGFALKILALCALAALPLSASQGRGGGGSPPPPGPMVLTVTATPPDCYSGAGCLDPSFGTLGKVSIDVGGVAQTGNASAVQPDGKVIAAGWAASATQPGDRFWVVGRFQPDGSIDTSFGAGGLLNLDFQAGVSSLEMARSIAIQPDGMILVGGFSSGGGTDSSIVVRLTTSGALDSSFGVGGKAVLTNGKLFQAMVLQPNGKIVVVETHEGVSTVFRLNGNGAIDTAFGVGGFRQITVAQSAYSLAIQSTGSIVVGGSSLSDAFLTRLTPTGALDAKFGKQGLVKVDFFGQLDMFSSLAVTADDSILAAGRAATTSAADSGQMAFAHFTANGALSSSFGSGGRLAIDFGGFDWARDVVVQSDGRILFIGHTSPVFGVTDVAVLGRLLSNGALDTSFGTGGIAMTSVQALTTWRSMTLDPNGLITLVGASYASSSDAGSFRWLLGRYYR